MSGASVETWANLKRLACKYGDTLPHVLADYPDNVQIRMFIVLLRAFFPLSTHPRLTCRTRNTLIH